MSTTNKVSSEDFVKAWQTSHCIEEVASRTGLTQAACASRTYYYRNELSVPLKRFVRHRGRGLRVQQLIDLALSLGGEDVQ